MFSLAHLSLHGSHLCSKVVLVAALGLLELASILSLLHWSLGLLLYCLGFGTDLAVVVICRVPMEAMCRLKKNIEVQQLKAVETLSDLVPRIQPRSSAE